MDEHTDRHSGETEVGIQNLKKKAELLENRVAMLETRDTPSNVNTSAKLLESLELRAAAMEARLEYLKAKQEYEKARAAEQDVRFKELVVMMEEHKKFLLQFYNLSSEDV